MLWWEGVSYTTCDNTDWYWNWHTILFLLMSLVLCCVFLLLLMSLVLCCVVFKLSFAAELHNLFRILMSGRWATVTPNKLVLAVRWVIIMISNTMTGAAYSLWIITNHCLYKTCGPHFSTLRTQMTSSTFHYTAILIVSQHSIAIGTDYLIRTWLINTRIGIMSLISPHPALVQVCILISLLPMKAYREAVTALFLLGWPTLLFMVSFHRSMEQFRNYKQQDAQEFLSFFLDRLEEELSSQDGPHSLVKRDLLPATSAFVADTLKVRTVSTLSLCFHISLSVVFLRHISRSHVCLVRLGYSLCCLLCYMRYPLKAAPASCCSKEWHTWAFVKIDNVNDFHLSFHNYSNGIAPFFCVLSHAFLLFCFLSSK